MQRIQSYFNQRPKPTSSPAQKQYRKLQGEQGDQEQQQQQQQQQKQQRFQHLGGGYLTRPPQFRNIGMKIQVTVGDNVTLPCAIEKYHSKSVRIAFNF